MRMGEIEANRPSKLVDSKTSEHAIIFIMTHFHMNMRDIQATNDTQPTADVDPATEKRQQSSEAHSKKKKFINISSNL